jgi:hypothetical protein
VPGDSRDAQKMPGNLAQMVLFAFGQTFISYAPFPFLLAVIPRSFQLSRLSAPYDIEASEVYTLS